MAQHGHHDSFLAWRRRQKPGAIMEPEQFEAIKRKAAASGADDPEAVAGAAYWRTAHAKFRARTRKRTILA